MSFVRFPTVALAGLISAFAFTSSQAVIVTDPTLHVYNAETSPSPIDPNGNVKIDAPGSTPASALYQLPQFGVIQDFAGFVNGSNGMAFTDPNRADVQFSFSGSVIGSSNPTGGTGAAMANNSYTSSLGDAIRFAANNAIEEANTMTANIAFGKYTGDTFETNSFPAVSAVAFTLNGQEGGVANTNRFSAADSIVVSYYGADGVTVLTSQTVNNFSETGYYGLFFSYAADAGDSISKVTIDVNIKSKEGFADRAQMILGIDDLGYTAIPEPAHVGLVLVLGAFTVALIRRRRR